MINYNSLTRIGLDHTQLQFVAPGGTGKTQLALNFIKYHKDKFDPILWIDAENQDTARLSFGRCAEALQIPVNPTLVQGSHLRHSTTVQAVCRWLQHRKELDEEWLVVFDNVDNLTWSVFDILPEGQRGNIIITSQDEQLSQLIKGCEKVSVDIMNRLEARDLLLRHLNPDDRPIGEDTKGLCDQVAVCLECLPLAVNLAGPYMRNDNIARASMGNGTDPQSALARYLDDYRRHQNELLRSSQYNGLSSYDKTVWTVWDTTVQKIEEIFPDRNSKLLLVFMAHFSSGFIQEEVFRLASFGLTPVRQDIFAEEEEFPEWLKSLLAVDGEKWDNFHYRRVREPLLKYGLLRSVSSDWPGVRMHSLVRWRAIQYKEDDHRDPWDRWHLEFILAACHELLKDTARPQFQRHIVIHIPEACQIHWSVLMTLASPLPGRGNMKRQKKHFDEHLNSERRCWGQSIQKQQLACVCFVIHYPVRATPLADRGGMKRLKQWLDKHLD